MLLIRLEYEKWPQIRFNCGLVGHVKDNCTVALETEVAKVVVDDSHSGDVAMESTPTSTPVEPVNPF